MLDGHPESLSVLNWRRATQAPVWPTARKKRVLVVEDDAGIRSGLRDLLEDEGYAVLCCEDGQQALDLLTPPTVLPEIIVLDLMLPVMDGWEFRLRQRANPRLADIPVLAISADSSAKAAAIDADGFLHKPFRADDVQREIAIIAHRLERDEHSQALMAMGTMVASVAHELKNPLTYVMGNLDYASRAANDMGGHCQSLRRASLSAPVSETCESILTELGEFEKATSEARMGLDRIVSLTHDLGNLGRKHQLLRERFPLKSAVESAIQMTAYQMPGQATLVREYLATPLVLGDCPRLTQVFINLLVNASQAVAQSTAAQNLIRIRMRVASFTAVTDIEDTGVGIPPEAAPRVFEPHFSTKPAGEGSGLGLAISRQIVAAHGGTIDFFSRPGEGSRFRVALPLAPLESDAVAL